MFTASDQTVDIGIIPWNVPLEIFDFKCLPLEMFAMQNDLKALNLREGSEVFFAGMFVYHMGSKRNIPILRFGKLCLVSDEKISFGGEDIDIYLIEANCFGGNSGAPVYFLTGYEESRGSELWHSSRTEVGRCLIGALQRCGACQDDPHR